MSPGPSQPEFADDDRELTTIIRSGLDCLGQDIAIYDAGLRLALANKRFVELRDIPEHLGQIGATFEDQIRFRAERGDYGPGEVEDHVRCHMEQARRFETHRVERTLADGTIVSIRGNPLPGGGIISIYTDITDRKRAEQALVERDELLERRNAELEIAKNHYELQGRNMAAMAEELSIARYEAEAINRAKSEFLANMSHELRTPLNAVIGFSQIMREETLGPLGSEDYIDYATNIFDSGQHLLELINDILDLSKVESGRDDLNEEILDVRDLVKSVLVLVQHRPGGEGVTLTTDLADDLALLRADARKLKQILVNLLSNAMKFTEAGGEVTLKIWCRPSSGYIMQVSDTGIGISLEDIPKALSVFGQVDGELSRKYEGTGLGLPLSKSLVEMHSGSLDLQSELGVGTTVTIRLPAERIVGQAEAADVAAAS